MKNHTSGKTLIFSMLLSPTLTYAFSDSTEHIIRKAVAAAAIMLIIGIVIAIVNFIRDSVNKNKHKTRPFIQKNLNKVKTIANRVSIEGKSVRSDISEDIYEIVCDEFEKGHREKGLWAKSLAECDGDENKAKARYLKMRAKTFIDAEKNL